MADRLSDSQRSANMARIRSKDTGPELIVRRALHAAGYRYSLHVKSLPGRPDIVLRRYRTAVFVHGCFWHRHASCQFAYEPKSRRRFWREKFLSNLSRDRKQVAQLLSMDWRVIVVWECALRGETAQPSVTELQNLLNSPGSRYCEIAA